MRRATPRDFFARLLLAGLVAGGAVPSRVTDFRILELCLETLSKANSKGVKKSLGAKKHMHAQTKKAYGKGKLTGLQLMFDAVKAVDTSLQNGAEQLSPPGARYWAAGKKSKAGDDSDDDIVALYTCTQIEQHLSHVDLLTISGQPRRYC